ncbi:MAG: M14 family metallopeptidase [Candidatus Aminicenantales bacterium]
MKGKTITTSLISSFFLTTILLSPSLSSEIKSPLTVAESSNFKATSRYGDVMDFIKKLQHHSPYLGIETLCVSTEGRKVPLLIIGKPLPPTPSAAHLGGRAVVYIQANIHAGEVEGKEASLMLARELLLKKEINYLLERLVVLISPIFNADGNEKISNQNRRNQAGPEEGVGVRYNGQNLDLNRDSMKLESPEVQGLVKNVLIRWDPFLVVDCHTTNGSFHQEPVTYSWPLNPNGDSSIITYMREKMMPGISSSLKNKYNTLSIPYGNFIDFKNPEKGWQTFSHLPRYLTNYVGLRNRLAILDENYAYADYRTRVYACYHFLLSILEYCYQHHAELIELTREADRKIIESGYLPSEEETFGLEFERKALKQPVKIRSWEMKVTPRDRGWPRVEKTDVKKTYLAPYYADFMPKRSVRFPSAYLVSASIPEVKEKLLQHGITVEELTEAVSLEVESFRLTDIKSSERIYQGHRLNSIKGEYFLEKREFPRGTLFISTSQPLGKLAAYLLEPESDDGLLVWNFFDRYLVSQWRGSPQTYPIHRMLMPVLVARERVK